MEGPSREEFTATMDRLHDTVNRGFDGVHERLDVLNGRTGKNEVEIARLQTRVSNLNKEVFERPRRRREDGGIDDPKAWLEKVPPKVLLALILIGLGGVFEGLRHLLPAAVRMLVAP